MRALSFNAISKAALWPSYSSCKRNLQTNISHRFGTLQIGISWMSVNKALSVDDIKESELKPRKCPGTWFPYLEENVV